MSDALTQKHYPFGAPNAAERETARKLAEERDRANAEMALRLANLQMPEDIGARAKTWGMSAWAEVLWNSAFQAGYREAMRVRPAGWGGREGKMSDRVTVCKPTEELDRLRMWADDAAAEITRLRADLAQLEQESDAEIALLRDYLASAERHRAEEMEERHRLAREVIRLRADLTAAQEREQRMREALEPGLSNLDALLNDHGYAEDGGMRRIVSELRAALGEPQ